MPRIHEWKILLPVWAVDSSSFLSSGNNSNELFGSYTTYNILYNHDSNTFVPFSAFLLNNYTSCFLLTCIIHCHMVVTLHADDASSACWCSDFLTNFKLNMLEIVKLWKWTTHKDITTRPYIQNEIFHYDIALSWKPIYIFSPIQAKPAKRRTSCCSGGLYNWTYGKCSISFKINRLT